MPPSEMEPRPPETYAQEIRVGWGDCDPARIAYTGHLPRFALQAIEGWWEDRFGAGWFEMEIDLNFGTPFVRLEMDFKHPVTPRHRLICHVWPVALGATSVTFRVDALQDGVLCFSTRTVSVFIRSDQGIKKAPPPAKARAIIEAHLPK